MRKVTLPQSEVETLGELKGEALRARVRELAAAGWPLAAIGAACTPPRPRSTIRFWALSSPSSSSSLSSSSSSNSTITTAENSRFDPSSTSAASPSARRPSPPVPDFVVIRQEPYLPLRKNTVPSRSPGLTEVDKGRIKLLQQLASKVRASTPETSKFALANEELTALANELFARGVTVREIADAAGVTYRAINKRIQR